MQRGVRRWILSSILLAACGAEKSAPAPTAPPTPPPADASVTAPVVGTGPATFAGTLEAPVSVRSSHELKARLTITNPGPDDMVLTRGALDLPMLALEVRAAGKRVNPIPPPVPRPEDADRIVIKPGDSLVRDYMLNIFSPELPPGDYELHCLMVACRAAPFTVTP
jgi:hypothetical protein